MNTKQTKVWESNCVHKFSGMVMKVKTQGDHYTPTPVIFCQMETLNQSIVKPIQDIGTHHIF